MAVAAAVRFRFRFSAPETITEAANPEGWRLSWS